MLITYLLLSAAFGLGWVLRGALCARQGGCDAAANDAIDELEGRIAELEAVAWAMRQGLTR